MLKISLVLISALSITACSTSGSNYKNAEWYKSSKRAHTLDADQIWDNSADKRPIAINEITYSTGMRFASVNCPIRTAPNTDSQILRTLKKGQSLWTQDNGGEWFRVFKKQGYAFINKTCFTQIQALTSK